MGRLHGGYGRRGTGKPKTAAAPSQEGPLPAGRRWVAARRNPFVYFHSLLDLGDWSAKPCRSPSWKRSGVGLRDPERPLHRRRISATPVRPPMPGWQGRRAGGGRRVHRRVGAEDPASPAYKKDGLLVTAFDQHDPPAGRPASRHPPATQVGNPAALAVPLPRSHGRQPIQPVLAAALDRGPLRPLAPRRRRRPRRSGRSPRRPCSRKGPATGAAQGRPARKSPTSAPK